MLFLAVFSSICSIYFSLTYIVFFAAALTPFPLGTIKFSSLITSRTVASLLHGRPSYLSGFNHFYLWLAPALAQWKPFYPAQRAPTPRSSVLSGKSWERVRNKTNEVLWNITATGTVFCLCSCKLCWGHFALVIDFHLKPRHTSHSHEEPATKTIMPTFVLAHWQKATVSHVALSGKIYCFPGVWAVHIPACVLTVFAGCNNTTSIITHVGTDDSEETASFFL